MLYPITVTQTYAQVCSFLVPSAKSGVTPSKGVTLLTWGFDLSHLSLHQLHWVSVVATCTRIMMSTKCGIQTWQWKNDDFVDSFPAANLYLLYRDFPLPCLISGQMQQQIAKAAESNWSNPSSGFDILPRFCQLVYL